MFLGRSNQKRKAQQKHAVRRFAQRHGEFVGQDRFLEMVHSIQEGRATFIEKQSNRVSVFDVALGEKIVRVVYDKHRKTIVTALPDSARTDSGGVAQR